MRHVLTVAVLVVSSVLFAGGSAQAASLVVSDARGDVLSADGAGETKVGTSVAHGDIVRTRFAHRQRAVVVRATYRSLQRSGLGTTHNIRIVTNAGLSHYLRVTAGPSAWSGTAVLHRPNGRHVECAVQHRINYGKNVLRVRIPRACLERPEWVRLGLRTAWSDGDRVLVDDAQRNSKAPRLIALTDRLVRG
ncbi:hypothetical protein [Nocardioides limicola]|uniref:hypothetical protein n=1 Tax=Nocardioides limicola TaxID=2803368 RepID=UPI00193C31E2|nr:hypothetical protein [Nocardioides sp. DJM-14]